MLMGYFNLPLIAIAWLLVGVLLGFIVFCVLLSVIRARRRIHQHRSGLGLKSDRLESKRLSDAIRERRQQQMDQEQAEVSGPKATASDEGDR